MICPHCEKEIEGEEMVLHGCYSFPEIVCLRCWTVAMLPFDCVQCFAEVTG